MSEYLPCLQQNCQKPAKKRTKTAKKRKSQRFVNDYCFFPAYFSRKCFLLVNESGTSV